MSLAATSVGNVALFAGGDTAGSGFSRAVDIYNSATEVWSTAQLSVARIQLAATSVGDVAIFAGGQSPASYVVDLFKLSTGTWSTAQLSVARMKLSATSVGNVALFAGGYEGALLCKEGGYRANVDICVCFECFFRL